MRHTFETFFSQIQLRDTVIGVHQGHQGASRTSGHINYIGAHQQHRCASTKPMIINGIRLHHGHSGHPGHWWATKTSGHKVYWTKKTILLPMNCNTVWKFTANNKYASLQYSENSWRYTFLSVSITLNKHVIKNV